MQLNNDSLQLSSFKYRGTIDCWISEKQIIGGVGIYKINTISDDYWSEISRELIDFTNVGDYELIIFEWNGSENVKFGVGFLLTCRSSMPLFVTIWEGKFYLHSF